MEKGERKAASSRVAHDYDVLRFDGAVEGTFRRADQVKV